MWGWDDVTIYVRDFMRLLRHPDHSDLLTWMRGEAETDPRTNELRRPNFSEEEEFHLVRFHLEAAIFERSAHGRSYAAQLWAVWSRSHHVPHSFREVVAKFHFATSSQNEGRHRRDDSYRDGIVTGMIIGYCRGEPFSIGADNYQLSMAQSISVHQEGSQFKLMTDCGAARYEWVERREDVSRVAADGSLVPMHARELDENQLVRLFDDVSSEWYEIVLTPEFKTAPYDPQKRDLYISKLWGEPQNSGRFSAETLMPVREREKTEENPLVLTQKVFSQCSFSSSSLLLF
jgi:hypothetical protein